MLRADGRRSAVPDGTDIVEMDTPFDVRVAMLREEVEAAAKGVIDIEADAALTLKDKMALNRINPNIS